MTNFRHEGPVWQVCWSHPKFGGLLASCSYDSKVFIWKEENGTFTKIYEHLVHESSVNSIAFGPFEDGLNLACASSDGNVSVLTCHEDGQWEHQLFNAHQIGCNSVSWGKGMLATGGCDNLIKLWTKQNSKWALKGEPLKGHLDWVRDVQFSPSRGLNGEMMASCSQDKVVFIWTLQKDGTFTNKLLNEFPETVWRVSWSLSGNILAVSCGDNKVYLWKETASGWENVSKMEEGSQ